MRKLTTKLFITSLIAVFALCGLNPAGADSKKPSSNSALSDSGQRAFDDLGRCLQSQGKEKVLDVFYLIDESGSLQGTDKDNKRADILSSSLIQLASFRKDVTVNYSVGFFAHSYGVWKSWTTVNQGGIVSEASKLAEEVRKRNNGKLTDWLQGINGAITELNAQHDRTSGCSTLVFLTDGGIELSTVDKTVGAINQLCSNRFDVLRKNNVTVLGILLKNDEYLNSLGSEDKKQQLLRMAWMQPMIEGFGRLYDNSTQSCGSYPVPKNYSAGALFVAQDPKDLAFEFLKLPPQIEGCKESPAMGGGVSEFEVERGISDFQIVTTAPNWSLQDPKGASLNANSKGIRIFETAGAAQIRVGTTANGVGKWKFNGVGGDSVLYFCSGLDIVINPGNELIAGRPGSLAGKVILQRNGLPADLSLYDSNHPITVEQIGGDGSHSQPVAATQSDPSNFFLENFTPTAGQSELEIRVTLYLTTKRGFKLTPISVSQKLEVRLPSNYPSLKTSPVVLSDLNDAKTPAKGNAVFKGPVGTDGKVCIEPGARVKVVNDSVSREDSYLLKTAGVDATGCMPIRDGEESAIEFTISNDVTAQASVTLEVPVTYYSDAEPDKKFTLGARVEFRTHIPGEKNVKWWEIILTVLGILLPLLLISFMSWLTTKLAFGRQVQRASYPVMVTPSDRYTARDGTAIVPDPNDFKIRPEQPDVRSFEDPIGKFRARISTLVLASPWFEIKAGEGTRVITLAHAAPQLKHRFSSGKLAPIPGDLAKIWALSIQDSDLSKFEKGTPIPGTLVVFKRNNLSNTNQFRDVFNGVTTKAGIWREVTRLAEVVKNENAKPEKPGKPPKEGKGGNGGGATPPKPPAPPRPGSGGAVRPGTTGGASPRPGSGSTTPPRPSGTASDTPNTPSTSSRPSGPSTPSTPPPRPGGSQPPKRI